MTVLERLGLYLMNFSVENVYSSGVLLIIITQLADNFDVISPGACGGSSLIVSSLQTWQHEHEENTATRGRVIPVRRIMLWTGMRGLINDNPWKFLSTISHSDSIGTLLTRAL